jgi:hypothetical protein
VFLKLSLLPQPPKVDWVPDNCLVPLFLTRWHVTHYRVDIPYTAFLPRRELSVNNLARLAKRNQMVMMGPWCGSFVIRPQVKGYLLELTGNR